MTTLSAHGLVGEVLAGRYVLEQRIGDGSMGTVYRARHVKMGRQFAVKVLHRHLVANPKVVRRFTREAELAGRLRHPNVIGVVDIGETDAGQHYLVMDYAPGYSLSALIEQCKLAPERVVDIGRQLCDGLQHAHDVGLVHRDFKPDNVIVDRDAQGRDHVRIVDFGIAILRENHDKDSGEQDRLTTAGLVVGTPHYMSPEQARGDQLDHRTDLFSLGIVLYEMLAGKLPFDGTGVDIARANMLDPTPRIAERSPDVTIDPLLEELVRKLLEKDAPARPQSAAEVRTLLDQLEHHRIAASRQLSVSPTPARRFPRASIPPEPAPPEPAPAPAPTTDIIPQHRRRRAAYVTAGLALALSLTLFLILRDKRASSAAPALPPPITAVADPVAAPSPPAATATATGTATASEAVTSPAPSIAPPRTSRNLPRETPRPRTPSPALAQPAAPGTPSASELAALYGSIGRELKRLESARGEDSAFDLWPRYRWIRINEVLSSPEKRAAAARMLSELRAEIAKR